MRLFKKIKELILGEDAGDSGWNLDGEDNETEEDMSGYYNDYDSEPTVLYSDNPQMPQEIKGGGNPDRLNDATMREVQRINATNLIPGQVITNPRGRRQMASGPRRIGNPRMTQRMQQQQLAQQQLARQQQWEHQQWQQQQQQQWEQQQWVQPPQQQWVQPPQPQQPVYDQRQQRAFYQQQQAYYQQIQPQGQAQGQDGQQQPASPIQRAPVNYGEPYSEMIVANGKYHFFLDLPGVSEDEIDVSYVNMNLVITGTRKLKSELMAPKVKGKGNKGKRPEFDALVTIPPFVEKFSYTFNFPRPVVQDSFKTELTQGVLHISMDILGESGPGGIAIKVGS